MIVAKAQSSCKSINKGSESRLWPYASIFGCWKLRFLHVAPSTTLTQRLIRRRPDIAGPAISLLLGTLRRTQEALAALHIKREARHYPLQPQSLKTEDEGARWVSLW